MSLVTPFKERIIKAYLDIETNRRNLITVIGIYKEDRSFTQLIRPAISRPDILEALEGVTVIVTYNGSCFDLPVIRKEFDLDLKKLFKQSDLKYLCWRRNLYGGLKKVEIALGIDRGDLSGLSGLDAVILWDQYCQGKQQQHLDTLLAYNKADVVNLAILEEKLGEL